MTRRMFKCGMVVAALAGRKRPIACTHCQCSSWSYYVPGALYIATPPGWSTRGRLFHCPKHLECTEHPQD